MPEQYRVDEVFGGTIESDRPSGTCAALPHPTLRRETKAVLNIFYPKAKSNFASHNFNGTSNNTIEIQIFQTGRTRTSFGSEPILGWAATAR